MVIKDMAVVLSVPARNSLRFAIQNTYAYKEEQLIASLYFLIAF